MTNREAHPDYKNYPVGMRVTSRGDLGKNHDRVKTAPNRWECECGRVDSDDVTFGSQDNEGRTGVIILHDPRTAGKPFAFAPVGDGTTKDTVYVFECACCGTDSRCPMHGAPRVRPAKESDMPREKPSALLVALREAEAAIQRAIEMEANKGA